MLDPIEEAKFADLREKCRELHVPSPPEIMIGLQVHDYNGLLICDDIQRGHSWLRNGWNAFLEYGTRCADSGSTYAAGSNQMKNISGIVVAATGYFSNRYIANVDVGTGDTSFSVEQFKLDSIVTTGAGAGQLVINAMNALTAAYANKTWTGVLSRIFNNNSGSPITIKETGLSGNIADICWERSVLSPAIIVPNGAQLTVSYRISMDFSAID